MATKDWDSQFLLSDTQKDLYMQLNQLSKQLPFPPLLISNSQQQNQNITNLNSPTSPQPLENNILSIETPQQFYTWFNDIEKEMTRGQEDALRECLSTVTSFFSVCKNIKESNSKTTATITNLKSSNKFVYEKTRGLQDACEKLLDEQRQLIELANDLDFKLKYFQSLEPITKFLNSSGDNICKEPEFIPTLTKLDHCISFIKSNPTYRESDLYLMRFRQCMTRSMTLIKMHVVNCIRNTVSDIRDKDIKPDEPLNDSLQRALFYVKFQKLGASLKPLIQELESRCSSHHEYLSLLKDCTMAYFNARENMLSPYIQHYINTINTPDLLKYVKIGSAYMLHLCTDEHKLYIEFFELGDDDLIRYLESLSMNLYNQFRPKILRETKIDELAEMCQSLLGYVDIPEDSKKQLISPIDNAKVELDRKDSLAAVHFVVRKTLEDAQQRLVFRAQQYIRTEIQGFRPRVEDIELLARGRGLPKPNQLMSTIGVAPVIDDLFDEKDLNLSYPETIDLQSIDRRVSQIDLSVDRSRIGGKMVYGGGEWYPALQRTLYILGRLYGSVPMTVFGDISAEAVDICRQSLIFAADTLASKQTKIDGQLFLIKNLLMLREHIIPYEDAQLILKQEHLDFASMIDALSYVLRESWTSNILNAFGRNLFAAAAPQVVENYADAKQLLDLDLKRACEDVILETAKSAVEPISSFMLKVSAFNLRASSRQGGTKEYLCKQNFATAEIITETFIKFKETLEKKLKFVTGKMGDYLGDKKTESILIRVIRTNIIDNYQAFHDIVTSEYDASLWNKVDTVLGIAIIIDQFSGRKSSIDSLPIIETFK